MHRSTCLGFGAATAAGAAAFADSLLGVGDAVAVELLLHATSPSIAAATRYQVNRMGLFILLPLYVSVIRIDALDRVVSTIRSNGTPARTAARRTVVAVPSKKQRTTSSSRINTEPR